jgi:FemAB-related protein (PEP-CTERM system-associated)
MIRALPDANGTWQSVVAGSSESNLAHSPEWFALIQRAYGHQPLYLCAEDDKSRSGVLPAFIVRRPFFGTVVTSMPFLDSGGPCSSSAAMARVLVAHLVAEARNIGARLVEIRCSTPLDIGSEPAQTKVNMTLPIPSDPDRLWRQLDKGVRNQVRKAERSGLSIDIGGVENLTPFYEAFAIRMRDLGSPVHAVGFLRAVLESFGSRARIILVRKGPTAVGGLVILAFKDRLIVPWAACLKEYFAFCPNMLLYWVALRTACVEGFHRFDFGRSTRNSGTYHFKCQWGAREEPLFWYTIPVTASAGSSPQQPGRRELFAKAWQHLPLGVTRYLGPRIRRYLVQ